LNPHPLKTAKGAAPGVIFQLPDEGNAALQRTGAQGRLGIRDGESVREMRRRRKWGAWIALTRFD
jgi:hypothetical protein